MMRRSTGTFISGALMLGALVAFTACESKKGSVGGDVEAAADNVGDAADKVGHEVKAGAETAGEGTKKGAEEVAEGAKGAAKGAATGGEAVGEGTKEAAVGIADSGDKKPPPAKAEAPKKAALPAKTGD